MDSWAVQVKNVTVGPFWVGNSFSEKPISLNSAKMGIYDAKNFEIRVLRPGNCCSSKGYRQPVAVRAAGKKNNNNKNQDNSSSSENGDRSIPEGDDSEGNSSSEGKKIDDTVSEMSQPVKLDWREFRAKLYANEQEQSTEADLSKDGGTPHSSKPLGTKWAHPIPEPETGCVLISTEKLDGDPTFGRTVVLLLSSGTRHPQNPFGVVINRPLQKKIKHMTPSNLDLASTFSDCSLHFGGPLEASMYMLKPGQNSKLAGFAEVIPGLYFGGKRSLDTAAGLIRKGIVVPQDVRFFVGYAGWGVDQLRAEIEADFWYVAACSSNLIFGRSSDSSEGLWEEILQLMGGHYSELSRKPKQDT